MLLFTEDKDRRKRNGTRMELNAAVLPLGAKLTESPFKNCMASYFIRMNVSMFVIVCQCQAFATAVCRLVVYFL